MSIAFNIDPSWDSSMTRVTLIDSQTAGISGDMILAALIDAGADIKAVRQTVEEIPKHYSKCKRLQLEIKEVRKHGFRATNVEFTISEEHNEVSAKAFLDAAERIASSSGISEKAASLAVNTIKTLLQAESRLHGEDSATTHLHEAGSADTLGDVFGTAAACDSLGILDEEIYCTPVAVGGGTVSFSHGTMSTPAPATLEILRAKSIPIVAGPEDAELTTPTGASILANLANRVAERYPPMVPDKVGYGAGKRELVAAPNLLRVVLGHTIAEGIESDAVQILETNLDDLSGEVVAYALNRLLESGAKDAWITSALFKKNRPGQVLHVLCDPVDVEKMAKIMLEETGTLGVRFQQWKRLKLKRDVETIELNIGSKIYHARIKVARDERGRVTRVKPEFDDVHSIASAVSKPAREVSDQILAEAKKKLEKGNLGN
jgi:uncharacterized protein (TIGR00299 family) protein